MFSAQVNDTGYVLKEHHVALLYNLFLKFLCEDHIFQRQ
jgi:hypothetical protein